MKKIDQVRNLFYRGDKINALRIVVKFPRLGKEKHIIEKAWSAYNNPRFYKSLGEDIDRLIEDGLNAIKNKYRF